MKRRDRGTIIKVILLTVIAVSFLVDIGELRAQEESPQQIRRRFRESGIEIPFIDHDGDGINDMLQNGWGLRFLNRYKKRQELWDMLNVEIIRGERGMMVDTDGDGIGDIAFHDYMKDKMDEMIDTDGDGVPDTSIRDLLGRRFKAFDRDGDGLPDDISREEMREMMREMHEWRQGVRNRVNQGLPPFVDEDGDGIPDDLPDGFGGRGQRHRGGR